LSRAGVGIARPRRDRPEIAADFVDILLAGDGEEGKAENGHRDEQSAHR
jgi:hypothetical protein